MERTERCMAALRKLDTGAAVKLRVTSREGKDPHEIVVQLGVLEQPWLARNLEKQAAEQPAAD